MMSETEENEVETSETAATVPPERKSGGGGIAWLALLVAALALAAVSYTIYQDWRAKQEIDLSSGNVEASLSNLSGRINATNDALTGTEAEFEALAQADATVANRIDALNLEQAESFPFRAP